MNGQNLYLKKPKSVIQDRRLSSTEADYLCLIAQLHNAGGCVASNKYFKDYFGVKRQTAQGIIGALKRKGFIATREKKSGGKTVERTIEIIDPDSRRSLLSDSRETPGGLAGNHGRVSRETPTLTLEVHKKKHTTGGRGVAPGGGVGGSSFSSDSGRPLSRQMQIAEENRVREIIKAEEAAEVKRGSLMDSLRDRLGGTI
jgi:hypothetical protein